MRTCSAFNSGSVDCGRAFPGGVANGSTRLDSGRGRNAPTGPDRDSGRIASTCWVLIGRECARGELPGDGGKSPRSVGDRSGLRTAGVEIPLGEGDLASHLSIIGLPKSRVCDRAPLGGEVSRVGVVGAGLCPFVRCTAGRGGGRELPGESWFMISTSDDPVWFAAAKTRAARETAVKDP